MNMKILKKYARAKINLGLEVLNKNYDGFHNINTVFKTIDLHDNMVFEELTENKIETSLDYIIPIETNLIFKAANKIYDYVGDFRGIKVQIVKNIPQGGGLGGGSTDAAATLQAVNSLYGFKLSFEELFDIAITLGADVPYFLKIGTAVGTSRGEALDYFSFYMPYYILLINTGIHVSTKEAYESLDRKSNSNTYKTNFKGLLQQSIYEPDVLKKKLTNDFEPYVFALYPQLAEIKDSLYQNGAVYASMSGSGSSIYGLFATLFAAKSVAASFKQYFTHISYPGF